MVNKKKVTKKIALSLLGISLFSAGVLTNINKSSEIYAKEIKVVNESIQLKNAKAKIAHLTKSLKTNYLGIKNQGTWEIYIKESRELINKIPNFEKSQRDALTLEVDRDEALVRALSRINQVEKSTTPKEQGGYGNYLGIKNAETWREYLRLASIDLDKVDKVIFEKQYIELRDRMNEVSLIVSKIEEDFEKEYNNVVSLFNEAKTNNDKSKAELALEEAKKLGTCKRSDDLEKEIELFLKGSDSNEPIIPTNPTNPDNSGDSNNSSSESHKERLERILGDIKVSIRGVIYNIKPYELDDLSYKLVLYNDNDSRTIFPNKKLTDQMIVYGEQDKFQRTSGSYYPLLTVISRNVYLSDIQKQMHELNEPISTEIDSKRNLSFATCSTSKYGVKKYVFDFSRETNTLYLEDN